MYSKTLEFVYMAMHHSDAQKYTYKIWQTYNNKKYFVVLLKLSIFCSSVTTNFFPATVNLQILA